MDFLKENMYFINKSIMKTLRVGMKADTDIRRYIWIQIHIVYEYKFENPYLDI